MPVNQHLVEVLCAIWFDQNKDVWDSTFFGKYHEKIISLGYTEKHEQKQYEVKINGGPPPSVEEGPLKMVFKNPEDQSVIILSNHYISFHKLPPYNGWDKLIEKIIIPGLRCYSEIGLGKYPKEVQALYLNRYNFDKGEKISNVFTFLPTIPNTNEKSITFQGVYEIDTSNRLQLKINGGIQKTNLSEYFFECSCTTLASNEKELLDSAAEAHDQVNRIYNSIIKK